MGPFAPPQETCIPICCGGALKEISLGFLREMAKESYIKIIKKKIFKKRRRRKDGVDSLRTLGMFI